MTDQNRYSQREGDAFRTSPLTGQSAPRDLQSEADATRSQVTETVKSVTGEARALGKEAQQLAADQAEKAREVTASQLGQFADALRAASKELESGQTGPAGELVSHAASGLERLSRSLEGTSTGEIVETVRRFGRENPIGFLAGSVLAGFALGRFAAASMPAASDGERAATESMSRNPVYPASPASSVLKDRPATENRGYGHDA